MSVWSCITGGMAPPGWTWSVELHGSQRPWHPMLFPSVDLKCSQKVCADRAQCHSSSTCLPRPCQQRRPLHSLRLLCRNPEGGSPGFSPHAVRSLPSGAARRPRPPRRHSRCHYHPSILSPPARLARLPADLAVLWTLHVIVTHVWVSPPRPLRAEMRFSCVWSLCHPSLSGPAP